jgi:lysozyme
MQNEKMILSDKAINLIIGFEGFSSVWYPDPALGWKVPTVMYGHTDSAGEPKYKDTKDMFFTKQEAKETLIRDLEKYESSLKILVKVPLNENQYGALVSLIYNIGEEKFSNSTLLKKLNNGDYDGASEEFEKWHFSGGKIVEGLCNRREAEYQMFISEIE